MTANQQKLEGYRRSNVEAAEITWADPVKYPAGSLLHKWSGLALAAESREETTEGGMSPCQLYKLRCLQCRHTTEISTGAPMSRNAAACHEVAPVPFMNWRGGEPPRAT
jgi:hypothetical protein